MIDHKKKRRIWPLVLLVAGIIFVIWLTLLPRELNRHAFDFHLDGLKESVTGLTGIEAIKTRATDTFQQLNDDEEEDNGTSLTDEEIRDLERRVFDDPQ